MSKAGASILRGASQALDYAKGKRRGFRIHVPEEVDVKAIREKLGMTQTEFADAFGFSVSSLRNWEQGRRRPERPIRILLFLIEKEPKLVQKALRAA
jgi:putative transcriptional regulator